MAMGDRHHHVGNLTADPELRTIGQGAQVASFTIANTRAYTTSRPASTRMGRRCSYAARHGTTSPSIARSHWPKACASSPKAGSDSTRIRRRTALTEPSWSCRVDEIGPSLRFRHGWSRPHRPTAWNPSAAIRRAGATVNTGARRLEPTADPVHATSHCR